MSLEVGTVVFVIDPKGRSIIPAQVNEQVVSRKIEGETITHKVVFPNQKVVTLEDLNATYFSTIKEVKDHLMSRAEEMINTSAAEAQSVAAQNFNVPSVDPDLSIPMAIQPTPEIDENMQMKLPDGQIANVKINIPEEFMNENPGN